MHVPEDMIEALLASEEFHAWIEGTATVEAATRWTVWAQQSPQHARAVQEASAILRGLAFHPPTLPDVEAEWHGVRGRLHASPPDRGDRTARPRITPPHAPPSRNPRRHRERPAWTVAGVLAVLLVAALGVLVLPSRSGNQMATVEAGPLEQRVVDFPGGTRVVLGARSRLRHPETWPEDGVREVWLEGEAFFEVQPHPDRTRPEFYVHTPDGTVEVLGTAFTVRRRHQRTMVVLNEGTVEVRVEGAADAVPASATLRPGDLVEFRQRQDSIRLRRVNPEVYSSWTTDVLLFDETPVGEVVERIEATYGLEVVLPDSTVLHRTLSGSIPNHQLDLLLRALSHTLDRAVYRRGDVVRIAPAPASTRP